jgi:hypothetical protein
MVTVKVLLTPVLTLDRSDGSHRAALAIRFNILTVNSLSTSCLLKPVYVCLSLSHAICLENYARFNSVLKLNTVVSQ